MQSIWCVSLHKQFLYVVFLFFKPFTVNLRGGKSHLKKRISSPIWAFLKHLAESPSMCMTWEVQAGYFKLPVGIICKAKEFRYNYAGFFFLMLPVLHEPTFLPPPFPLTTHEINQRKHLSPVHKIFTWVCIQSVCCVNLSYTHYTIYWEQPSICLSRMLSVIKWIMTNTLQSGVLVGDTWEWLFVRIKITE